MQFTLCLPPETATRIREQVEPYGGSVPGYAAKLADDKSHDSAKVINRDSFIESACKSAELKLVRFPARASYSVQEIASAIG